MPRSVDSDARRAQIASAAFTIARRGSLADVTFRAVAAELGSSTTAVTHYAATREELLRLLVLHAFGTRERRLSRVLRALPARSACALLIEVVLPIHDESRLLARIYLETLTESASHPELREALATHDVWLAAEVERLLSRLDIALPLPVAVDILVTTLDGIMCTAITNTEQWTPARQRRTARQVARVIGLGEFQRVPSRPSIVDDAELPPSVAEQGSDSDEAT